MKDNDINDSPMAAGGKGKRKPRGRGATAESHSYLKDFGDHDQEFFAEPIRIPGKYHNEKEIEQKLRKRLSHFETLARDLNLCILTENDGFGGLPSVVLGQIITYLGSGSRALKALACTNKHFFLYNNYYVTWCLVQNLTKNAEEGKSLYGCILWHPYSDILEDTSSRMLLNLAAVNSWRAREVELSVRKIIKGDDDEDDGGGSARSQPERSRSPADVLAVPFEGRGRGRGRRIDDDDDVEEITESEDNDNDNDIERIEDDRESVDELSEQLRNMSTVCNW